MRGSIKLAKVSIKYKEKKKGGKKTGFELIKTKKVETTIVIDEQRRILKFKSRTISKVCRELGLNDQKLIDPDINEIEILKDLGKTNYDI